MLHKRQDKEKKDKEKRLAFMMGNLESSCTRGRNGQVFNFRTAWKIGSLLEVFRKPLVWRG